jgi:hypothetical protein
LYSSCRALICRAIITNTLHNTDEACAIVRNLVALVERQQVEFAAALFRSIWGAEPGRLPFFNRPSFYGEILCCWRPRWIPGTKKSPMHAYTWYVWRKEPRSGPSLKIRVGRHEGAVLGGVDPTVNSGSLHLGDDASLSSAPIACSIVNPDGHS